MDKDKMAIKYGLKEDNKPLVNTIRDGVHFLGYSPAIKKDYFAIAQEYNSGVRIYTITDSGDWVDIFKLNNIDEIEYVIQALLIVQYHMKLNLAIQIVSSFGTLYYDPKEATTAEISIGGSPKQFLEDSIQDLIQTLNLVK